MLQLVFAALAAQFHDGDTGGVVDDEVGLSDHTGAFDQFCPVLVGEISGTDGLRIDAGFEGEQSIDELLFRHFQTEYGDRHIFAECHMLGNVEHQRRFSHRRTRCHQDQIGRLESGCLIIEINKSGRNTGNISLRF